VFGDPRTEQSGGLPLGLLLLHTKIRLPLRLAARPILGDITEHPYTIDSVA